MLWKLLKLKTKLLNSYYKHTYKRHKINFLNWAKILNDLYSLEQHDKINKNSIIQKIITNQNNINAVYSSLCDEKSKINYQQELAFKITFLLTQDDFFANFQTKGISRKEFSENFKRVLHDKSMPHIDAQQESLAYCLVTGFYYHQYEYTLSETKKISVEHGDIVIDCGAAFGDTAYWAYTNGAKKIYCFEIDPKNLQILKDTIINNKFDNITEIVPKALGATCGEIYLHTIDDAPLWGHISGTKENDKSIPIPLTTIDTFCAENNVKPTFIKMDIEGSELEALKGAKETIRKNKPKLAISIYHKLEDMWELPLLIHEIEPGYKFYCKKNSPVAEFILHAIYE